MATVHRLIPRGMLVSILYFGNIEAINEHFIDFQKIIGRYQIQFENLFTADKVGCRSGIAAEEEVITLLPKGMIPSRPSLGMKELVTVMESTSPAGVAAAPCSSLKVNF